MESTEFRQGVRGIVGSFKSRLPQRSVMTLEATLAGGELAIALKELVHALVNNKTTFSSSEYQQLVGLIHYLEDPQLMEKLGELEHE
jgi:hypothetical protein